MTAPLPRILLCEQQLPMTKKHHAVLVQSSAQITAVNSLDAAIAALASVQPHIFVLCVRNESVALQRTATALRVLSPATQLLMIVGRPNLRGATTALRHGAHEYLGVHARARTFSLALQRLLATAYITPSDISLDNVKMPDKAISSYATLAENYALLANQMRDKDDVISLVSHELRSPLTTINGYLELMKRYGEKLPATKTQDFIDRSLRATSEMAHLTDMLMQVIQFESATMQVTCTPLPVIPLLNSVLEQCELLLADHRCICTIDPDLSILADATSLQHILRNLFSNAIKYSPEGGDIHITVRQEGDAVEFTVRDHGLGIAPDKLPYIFDRFSRVHDRERWPSIRGAGLGLYICRQLVALQNGTIQAVSQPGIGSTFTVVLPLAHPIMSMLPMTPIGEAYV